MNEIEIRKPQTDSTLDGEAPVPSQRVIEKWLPVVGFEGHYEVSDIGRVRSLARTIVRKNGSPFRCRGQLLDPQPREGYKLVRLRDRRMHRVHGLVLSAFVGPRPAGMEVLHGDGNRANNRLSNLRYGTSSENKLDAVRHGTLSMTARQTCPRNHPLRLPNLVAHRHAAGERLCLACTRAYQRARTMKLRGQVVDFKAVADACYADVLMGIRRDRP